MSTATVCSKFGEALRDLARACLDGKGTEARQHEGCCGIPETRCPPRCVGVVQFQIGRGAVPEATIVVRNVAQVPRQFAFSATELAGPSVGAAALSVSPPAALLSPGESVVVHLELRDSKALSPLQEYRAELRVRGAYEQIVALRCRVGRDAYDECVVADGPSLKDRALTLQSKPAIAWTFQRGMLPEATIRIDNHGTTTQVFTATPSMLVGATHDETSQLAVTPDGLQLAAGQSGAIRLQLQGSLGLVAGQTYRGEVVIQGFHEERVSVCAEVGADPSDHIEVTQGDAPTHVRAHHWYHHFQCTEDCQTAE
jgi:hypothetical protein